MTKIFKIICLFSLPFFYGSAFANQPKDWQLGFQNPASDGKKEYQCNSC